MNNNSTAEKLNACIALIALFFILIPSFASVWVQFIPDDSFVVSVKKFSYFYAILLFSMLGYTLYKSGWIQREVQRSGNKALLLFLIPPFTIWVFVSMFQNGVPLVLHQIGSEIGEKQYIVSSKSDNYHDTKCNGGTYIEHHSLSSVRVCGLTKKDWNSIQAGDKLTFLGSISRYGISYSKIVVTK